MCAWEYVAVVCLCMMIYVQFQVFLKVLHSDD